MKARNNLLILCLCFNSIILFGQEQKKELPTKVAPREIDPIIHMKKLGLTLQVSTPSRDDIRISWFNSSSNSINNSDLSHKSYAFGLLVSYKMNDQAILRFRFGLTHNLDEGHAYFVTFNGAPTNTTIRGKQTKYHFAPGIVWSLMDGMAKFNLYGGFEIPINLHGQYKFTENVASTYDSYVLFKDEIILPKGYSMGVGAIFGFSYAPLDWCTVGAEFSPSLLYAKLSGKTKETNSFDPFFPNYTNDEDKGYTFYDQRLSLNLSVWF